MRPAFIVVAYRSAAELPGYLDSIRADAGPDCEIVVVDNASPDDSRAVATAHSAGPRVVVSDRNLGFGGGCNLGASQAGAASDSVFMLNPDARLRPGTTARLASLLDRDPGLGVVAPRVVDPSGESQAASAGAEPCLRSNIGHFLMLGRVPGLRRLFPPVYMAGASSPARPDWVSGAAMMIRRAAFEEVGGFDESLFMYMEDVDLCRRLREKGWGVAYDPQAVVDHLMGHSQSTDQAVRWYTAYHLYIAQHHGALRARVASLVAAIGMGSRALTYARRRPVNSARMARSARAALRFVFSTPRPTAAPDAEPTA
jgi:N-acetylglucosaminyl-diphospho-decaprenol L-rhamnosyltransferase